MQQHAETHRIGLSGAGFGEASEETIEERAAAIAQADGREEVEDRDRQAAFVELRAPIVSPNDVVEEAEIAASEDRPDAGVPPTSAGSHAERLELDDEETLPEALVVEGIEEADRDSRTAAADPEGTGDLR